MSGRVITKYVLTCDACEADFEEHPSAVDAREAAQEAGWTFPYMLRKGGKPSANRHDVCPACTSTFQPRRDPKSSAMEEAWEECRKSGADWGVGWQGTRPAGRGRR